MDDEFALCWNNFQDNISTGFQNLFDRGDLIDVTIACDGKLLHAHKIVLAICSPYFQEMFITNPCKHPIIILKDVSYGVMCELLQFMYQGVVNVKHTELSSFMKVAQTLQVKGLATTPSSASSSSSSQTAAAAAQKSPNYNHHQNFHHSSSQQQQLSTSSNNKNGGNGSGSNIGNNDDEDNNNNSNNNSNNNNNDNNIENSGNNDDKDYGMQSQTQPANKNNPISESSSSSTTGGLLAGGGNGSGNSKSLKRMTTEFLNNAMSTEGLSIYPRKQMRRFFTEQQHHNNTVDSDLNDSSMDNINSSDDGFLPPIPQISMVESRFDINSVKREGHHGEFLGAAAVAGMRNALPQPFNFDYTGMYSGTNKTAAAAAAAAAAASSIEYPNDLHMMNEFPKGAGNHMDIPSGSSITMLSSTSLLHGNCIFNRNNTVATQQGMKTYWLCKSYRITMCRARCITHQGRVISATGVHNHPPHMKSPTNNDALNSVLMNPSITVGVPGSSNSSSNNAAHTAVSSSSCYTSNSPPPSSSSSTATVTTTSRLHHSTNMSQNFPNTNNGNNSNGGGGIASATGGVSLPQQSPTQHISMSHHHHHHHPPLGSPQQTQPSHPHQLHHGNNISSNNNSLQGVNHLHPPTNNATVLHNMMQNVLSQNNLMHLTNMAPMLNPFPPAHPSQTSVSGMHSHITPILADSPTINSPSNRGSSHSHSQLNSPNIQSNSIVDSPQSSNHTNDGGNQNNMQLITHPSASDMPRSEHQTSPENECPSNRDSVESVTQDSSRSSAHTTLISSITISPSHHHQFKIEHM